MVTLTNLVLILINFTPYDKRLNLTPLRDAVLDDSFYVTFYEANSKFQILSSRHLTNFH